MATGAKSIFNTARGRVVQAIAAVTPHFPDLGIRGVAVEGLSPADRRFAVALHRLVLQRWRTLSTIAGAGSRTRWDRLDPSIQAVLLVGAAQVLLMDRIPPHAAVSTTVDLARAVAPGGAAKLVNAVMRRLVEAAGPVEPDAVWTPSPDVVPLEHGVRRLNRPLLPGTADMPLHLAEAVSLFPRSLLGEWLSRFGMEGLHRLARHALINAPTIVADPPADVVLLSPDAAAAEDAARAEAAAADAEGETEAARPSVAASEAASEAPSDAGPRLIAHDQPGFALWAQDHDGLAAWLNSPSARAAGTRVQDPTSAAVVRSAATTLRASGAHEPALVVDVCAGRGVKTRQLAHVFPNARVLASDASRLRLEELREVAKAIPAIAVLTLDALHQQAAGQADLVLLDVPCSNTGVLARRLEARYRADRRHIGELLYLQQTIVERAVGLLKPGGWLTYATCSLLEAENDRQTQRITGAFGLKLESAVETMPSGLPGAAYHDGGYVAHFRKP